MKKFYENVEYKKSGDVYKIYLDGNELKTPMKNELSFDYKNIAANVAMEWKNQNSEVKPETMPFNRYANSMIDRIAPNREAVIKELIEYASSDVICYRNGENSELLAIQDKKWNFILDWFDKQDIHLEVAYDVFPIEQDEKSVGNFKKKLEKLSLEYLSLLYFASSITKSTLLSYAFIMNKISCTELFDLSMLEELWQAEKWGKEEEAEENRNRIKKELGEIALFRSVVFNTFHILVIIKLSKKSKIFA
jgi:chaperone required for assembly of F1-ATPase